METDRTAMFKVEMPKGSFEGDLLLVAAPNGTEHEVQIPIGVCSGQEFEVEKETTINKPEPEPQLRVRVDIIGRARINI